MTCVVHMDGNSGSKAGVMLSPENFSRKLQIGAKSHFESCLVSEPRLLGLD